MPKPKQFEDKQNLETLKGKQEESYELMAGFIHLFVIVHVSTLDLLVQTKHLLFCQFPSRRRNTMAKPGLGYHLKTVRPGILLLVGSPSPVVPEWIELAKAQHFQIAY